MYLAAYHFNGDSADLLARYDTLDTSGTYRPIFRAVVETDDGISIYDGCPTREVFEGFAYDPKFQAELRRVGLPLPVVVGLGEVHTILPAAD